MIPHIPINHKGICGMIPHITIIQKGVRDDPVHLITI
jgi:hypothetical protein